MLRRTTPKGSTVSGVFATLRRGLSAVAVIVAGCLLGSFVGFALASANTGPYSGEPLPRFASLRAELVYLRVGPGQNYPIRWELTRRHMPVQITGEYGAWRKVRLHDGEVGWIHRAMLTTRRYAAPHADDTPMRDDPRPSGRLVAFAGEGVALRLRECVGDWCRVEAQGMRGWVERTGLWGVGPRD